MDEDQLPSRTVQAADQPATTASRPMRSMARISDADGGGRQGGPPPGDRRKNADVVVLLLKSLAKQGSRK
jgi:hypothetical protein